jgi:hypothetical protein
MYPTTTCPTEFGKKARSTAKRLLAAFESPQFNRSSLKPPVTVVCHRVSGRVWLTDAWGRSAMIHRGELHDWHLCLSCHDEGPAETFFADPEFGRRCGYCGEKSRWL